MSEKGLQDPVGKEGLGSFANQLTEYIKLATMMRYYLDHQHVECCV
jgi:hypothetical protein